MGCVGDRVFSLIFCDQEWVLFSLPPLPSLTPPDSPISLRAVLLLIVACCLIACYCRVSKRLQVTGCSREVQSTGSEESVVTAALSS